MHCNKQGQIPINCSYRRKPLQIQCFTTHNPKVVGSNPAPATISPEVSNAGTSGFLAFLGFFKDVQNGLIF